MTTTGLTPDVEKRANAFKPCQPCHAIGPGAQNKIGPELNGLDGRKAGTVANFNYSDADKNSGIVRNEQTFKEYIKDPKTKISGTKMIFAGAKTKALRRKRKCKKIAHLLSIPRHRRKWASAGAR